MFIFFVSTNTDALQGHYTFFISSKPTELVCSNVICKAQKLHCVLL